MVVFNLGIVMSRCTHAPVFQADRWLACLTQPTVVIAGGSRDCRHQTNAAGMVMVVRHRGVPDWLISVIASPGLFHGKTLRLIPHFAGIPETNGSRRVNLDETGDYHKYFDARNTPASFVEAILRGIYSSHVMVFFFR
jgi:hypothetical protein